MVHSIQPVVEEDDAGHDVLVVVEEDGAGGADRSDGRDERGAGEAMSYERSDGCVVMFDMGWVVPW